MFVAELTKGIWMNEEQPENRRNKRGIEYAESNGNVNRTCRRFGVARPSLCLWRERYPENGDEGSRADAAGQTIPKQDVRRSHGEATIKIEVQLDS